MAKRKPTNKYYFSVEGETSYAHRKQYITLINRAFCEKFENMDEYKHEGNFKRCLSKMNLVNVIDAIKRARIPRNGFI